VSQSYLTLIIALMVTGIGGGFTEALINPLVIDIHPNDSGKYLNITNAFFSIGVMTAALLFGELLTLGLSWRTIFQIAALGALTIGVWFNFSYFPPAVWDEPFAWHVVGKILVLPGFWLFAAAIALGAGVESAFTFWSRSYVETYLKDIPRAGAIAVVIFAGMMAAGRLLTARLSRFMSLRMIMLWSALLGVIVSGLIPFASHLFVFYALLALAGLATACFWPTILAEAAGYLKVNATILFVLLASVGIVGFGLIPWFMGVIGDRTNLRTGFSVIPGLFVILIVTLIIEWQISRNTS
jgi:fucose permease